MSRSYRMICPISRALDRVGDRWTLLILRDLHAGPMRFGELQGGLPGAASNLLVTRLQKLQSDGLVERDGPLYQLTDLGLTTDGVLWELAQLGGRMPPDPDVRRPSHLRLAAVTLQSALRAVAAGGPVWVGEMVMDGESFTIRLDGASTTVRYAAPHEPTIVVHTSYEPFMAAVGGEIPLAEFRSKHVRIEGDPQLAKAFQGLMEKVMVECFDASV